MWEDDAKGMNPRIRPTLNLVIECKQSELPYVFFLREGAARPDYPRIAALPHNEITFTTDDDPSTYTFDVLDALGMGFHPFVTSSCPTAISLSRVVRKGKDLAVTGEESYRGLTLPLLKATDHLVTSCRPSRSRYFFDARLIVSLAVIRATMVGVSGEDQSDNLEAVPWVRVHHLQPPAAQDESVASVQAFDVVHESYLQTYLQKLLEFAEEFAKRSQDTSSVLLAGRGFSSGLGHHGMPGKILPLTATTRRIKARLYAESLWMYFTRRVPPYGEYLRPPLSKRGVAEHEVGEERKSRDL